MVLCISSSSHRSKLPSPQTSLPMKIWMICPQRMMRKKMANSQQQNRHRTWRLRRSLLLFLPFLNSLQWKAWKLLQNERRGDLNLLILNVFDCCDLFKQNMKSTIKMALLLFLHQEGGQVLLIKMMEKVGCTFHREKLRGRRRSR